MSCCCSSPYCRTHGCQANKPTLNFSNYPHPRNNLADLAGYDPNGALIAALNRLALALETKRDCA